MKRALKILALASLLTVLVAVPAMAEEVTDPKTVLKEDGMVNFLTAHQAKVEAQVNSVIAPMADQKAGAAHKAVVMNQVARYENIASDNYIKYLDAVIYNLKNTERIKKEIVTNYKWLANSNPQFNNLIPAAQADADQASAWVKAYEDYRAACKADLDARYPR